MLGSSLPGIPRRLWLDARAASHRLLVFDYDGTLAPLQLDPQTAHPLPGLLERLDVIVDRGTTEITIVSGRPVRELAALVGSRPFTLIGEHGWDVCSGGRMRQRPLPKLARLALERAAEIASHHEWAHWIERKRTCLMLHTRGQPLEFAGEVEGECARLWRFADAMGLERRCVDGGLELRAPEWNEGRLVRQLIAESPRGALPIYLGDDETDEDAFRSVRSHGYGIRVGAPTRTSRANGRLPSVEAVREFLDAWLRTIEQANPSLD